MNTLTLLEFWAPWCGPCKSIKPVVEKVLTKFENVKLIDINVDENPDMAREYGIKAIPTLILKKGDKIVRRHTGTATFDQLVELLSV